MKKKYLWILIMAFTSIAYAVNIELTPFENEALPNGQSGCWFYQPADKKQSGRVIGFGESSEGAIYFMLNGKKEKIGNWAYDYQTAYHDITYHNDKYKINIHSEVMSESDYSVQLDSTLTITTESGSKTFKAFGECGS